MHETIQTEDEHSSAMGLSVQIEYLYSVVHLSLNRH